MFCFGTCLMKHIDMIINHEAVVLEYLIIKMMNVQS